jgi:hypothetical protein
MVVPLNLISEILLHFDELKLTDLNHGAPLWGAAQVLGQLQHWSAGGYGGTHRLKLVDFCSEFTHFSCIILQPHPATS